MDYGLGAIFGCPAHDQRDLDFANKYKIEVIKVVEDGKVGFMQFLSILPLSYPGISILNDDMGYISKRTIY